MDKPLRESHLHRYWSVIIRGKRMVLLITVAVTALAALYTFMSKPVYESTARILIDMNGRQSSLYLFEHRGAMLSNKLTNEIENLKSYSTASAVAHRLLEKKYMDASAQERIPVLIMPDVDSPDTFSSVQVVTERLMRAIDCSPTRDSDIIKITARSANAAEAALLANTYADVYADRNLDASRAKLKSVREFLDSQLNAEHVVLEQSEQELQRYMRTSGMVTLDAEAKRVIEQLAELEARRDAIVVEATSRSKTLTSYKQELSVQEPNVARSIEQSNDAYIRILQEQLASLELQRDVILSQNPSLPEKNIYNRKLDEIDGQISALKKSLRVRTKDFLASLQPGEGTPGSREGSAGFIAQMKQKIIEQQIELDGLDARKEALNKVISGYEVQFNQIPQKSIQLAKLQRSALSNEKLYLMIQEKLSEAAITEKSEFGYVDIMDPAIVPTRPVSPNVLENLFLGVLVGLGLGLMVVLLRADLDIRVRDPDDLKRFGYFPLTTIGCINTEKMNGEEGGVVRSTVRNFDKHLVTYHSPLSPISESYRYLQTNIQFSHHQKSIKSIVFTSANPQEGKSTTASNAAIAFAESEIKVLLVDADLRRPSLHKLFGEERVPGLAGHLLGKATFSDIIRKGVLENLDLVLSGRDVVNPAGMLGSNHMRKFIERVCQAYDIVIFDTPPLHAVTDAAVLSTHVDGAVIVVSAGYTKIPSVERAAESLTEVGGTLLGVVLNNYDFRKAIRGGYGFEGYGYYGYTYSNKTNGEKKKRVLA